MDTTEEDEIEEFRGDMEREDVLNAFARYDSGERPNHYGRPRRWFIQADNGQLYPLKIIYALAANIERVEELLDTIAIHSEELVKKGKELSDKERQRLNDGISLARAELERLRHRLARMD